MPETGKSYVKEMAGLLENFVNSNWDLILIYSCFELGVAVVNQFTKLIEISTLHVVKEV